MAQGGFLFLENRRGTIAFAAISNTQLPYAFWNRSRPNGATEVGPGPSYTRTGTLEWPRQSWSCEILVGIRT